MSKALQFLVEKRPEAMAAYFAFLKDNGSRLDAKTRDLISIITKVAVQTEAGLRQYVKRAVRDGVAGDEILDALLMAFPALGLSKIVWAVDIMLQMDIPGISVAGSPAAKCWHDVCAAESLPPAGVIREDCDGKGMFIVCDDHRTTVYDACCPHEGNHIPADGVSGWELKCPRHGWTFDLRTGAGESVRGVSLAVHEHKIEQGRLYVEW